MPLLRSPGPLPPPPHFGLDPAKVVRLLAPFLSTGRRRLIEEVLRRRLVSLTVVLENLYDPHNGAAVLRTCEAMGLLHVHVVESEEAFHFSRKVSQNAHKWLSVYLYPSVDECLGALQRWGFECWAAVPPPRPHTPGAAAWPGPPVEVERPLALVFGNEHAGLSRRALELANELYTKGLGEFVNVLLAERTLFENEDALIQSQTAISENLVALYKALGGGWDYDSIVHSSTAPNEQHRVTSH
jgi:tRNA (guanosine-2'-O-)-methyltransferase